MVKYLVTYHTDRNTQVSEVEFLMFGTPCWFANTLFEVLILATTNQCIAQAADFELDTEDWVSKVAELKSFLCHGATCGAISQPSIGRSRRMVEW